jgi:hypothetical protein
VFANLAMVGDLYGEHLGASRVGDVEGGLRDSETAVGMTLPFKHRSRHIVTPNSACASA